MGKEDGKKQVEISEKSGGGIRLERELEKGKETGSLEKENQVLSLFGAKVGVVPMNKSEDL